MFLIWQWFLMVLPFALWGTAMAAMAPLVTTGGPVLVAFLRLLPAGLILLASLPLLGRSWSIAPSDFGWFLIGHRHNSANLIADFDDIQNFYIRRNFFKNIFDQAMPITFSLFMVSIGGFILLYFLIIFGDKAIAGYGSALRFEQIFILPIIGLNTAVLSIAGQNFGARRYDRVREVYF